MEKEKLTVEAFYDKDSRRYHRFVIDGDQGITGAVYIPKGEEIPDEVTIELRTARQKDAKRTEKIQA